MKTTLTARRADSYERTYSQQLQTDFAIACALAGVPEGSADDETDRMLAEQLQAEHTARQEEAEQQRRDHDLAQQLHDHDLALQLQQKERAQQGARRRRSARRQLRRLDKQLRALLSNLSITKVIPRLNPSLAPSSSYVSEDRQRLLLRLDMYGLRERVVVGDGACQFRSIADQLWFQQERHPAVREAVVAQLLAHPERYRDYVVATDYQAYVELMSRPTSWGDHVTLQAAANAYNCRICIVSSFLDSCVISISPTTEEAGPEPQGEQQLLQQAGEQLAQAAAAQAGCSSQDASDRTLWLAFWAEVHYNSLAPKAPAGPSDSSLSDDGSSSDTSSSEVDDANDGRRRLGSRLKQAATHTLPASMLRR